MNMELRNLLEISSFNCAKVSVIQFSEVPNV